MKKFDFTDESKDVSVFDDRTLQGRLFQMDSAAKEKDLIPTEGIQTEGRQRMEVSKKERSQRFDL